MKSKENEIMDKWFSLSEFERIGKNKKLYENK
jgi:hypothetical protein